MSKSEELKERISYLKGILNVLPGMEVLIAGGLASLYLKDQVNEVFWCGYVFVILILFCCYKVAQKIEEHLIELGGL